MKQPMPLTVIEGLKWNYPDVFSKTSADDFHTSQKFAEENGIPESKFLIHALTKWRKSKERYMNKMPNMPTLRRWVQVRDWWSGSYEKNGRWYVEATLTFENCKKDKYSMICGEHHNYCVNLSFWGNDDTGISCEDIGFDDLEEAYKQYKWLRKFLNHLKKMKTIDLKRYLLAHGFTWA